MKLSTVDEELAYIDEFIIGRVEGFFDVQQESIGVRPSGYIKRFNSKWMTIAGKMTLRIEYESDQCGLDIPLIGLANFSEFEEIDDPLTHFYTFDTFTAKIDRRSKVGWKFFFRKTKKGKKYCCKVTIDMPYPFITFWLECVATTFKSHVKRCGGYAF